MDTLKEGGWMNGNSKRRVEIHLLRFWLIKVINYVAEKGREKSLLSLSLLPSNVQRTSSYKQKEELGRKHGKQFYYTCRE